MLVQEIMAYLSQIDPEVGASIQKEFSRQQKNIELIASENIVSPGVMLAMGTCLTNKYAEGYPGHRYYGGCYAVDVTEELARQRALSAVRLPVCQCSAPFRCQREPGRLLRLGTAGRHHSRDESGPRRPPEPRKSRQYFRKVL